MSKAGRITLICSIVVAVISIFLAAGFYDGLKLTEYSVTSERIPESFEGAVIVQISDFHCKSFGHNENQLIDMIKECNPDMIFFTGDIIDGEHDLDNVIHLLRGLKDVAPIYAVWGNNEYDDRKKYVRLIELYDEYGVVLLNNKTENFHKGDDYICIGGQNTAKAQLENMDVSGFDIWNEEAYNVLLYHYSDAFPKMSEADWDLVFSGHQHGGLIRLPFIGGIVGHDSMFPDYEYGMYELNGTTLISSAGLGDAVLPRFFNRPEVVKVTLHTKTK